MIPGQSDAVKIFELPLLRRVVLCAGVTFLGGVALLCAADAVFPLPHPKPYSLVVEDRRGGFVQAFRARDGIWRLRTVPGEVPDRLKRVLLAKEDRWFYYHPGINPVALMRAIVQNAASRRRVSGASTITMQVARMLEPKERTYAGKLREMMALLEKTQKEYDDPWPLVVADPKPPAWTPGKQPAKPQRAAKTPR